MVSAAEWAGKEAGRASRVRAEQGAPEGDPACPCLESPSDPTAFLSRSCSVPHVGLGGTKGRAWTREQERCWTQGHPGSLTAPALPRTAWTLEPLLRPGVSQALCIGSHTM